MLKKLIAISLVLSFSGCASNLATNNVNDSQANIQTTTSSCPGDTELPAILADQFDAVDDEALLKQALGEPMQGSLCQGKVYQASADAQITLYRAWNSTNPGSQLGKWWAAQIPQGKTANYRSDNKICYQWSPLDKMTQCRISPGTKVVIGPGQSAACPGGYITYPASAEKQIYIANAPEVVIDCVTFDDQFNWHQVQPSE